MGGNLSAVMAFFRVRLRSQRLSPAAFWIWLSSVGLYQVLGLAFVLVTTMKLKAGSAWFSTLTYGIFQATTGLSYAMGAWAVFFASKYVRRGELDQVILLPQRPYLTLPLLHLEITELIGSISGFVIAVIGLHMGGHLTISALLLTCLGVILGACVVYSFFVLAASLPLLNKQFSGSINIVMDIIQFGQYPVHLYPSVMRTIFTWVLPVVLIANLPAEIAEGHTMSYLPILTATSLVLFLGAHWVFKHALRKFQRHW